MITTDKLTKVQKIVISKMISPFTLNEINSYILGERTSVNGVLARLSSSVRYQIALFEFRNSMRVFNREGKRLADSLLRAINRVFRK